MNNPITINMENAPAEGDFAGVEQMNCMQIAVENNEIYILVDDEFKLLKNLKNVLVNGVMVKVGGLQNKPEPTQQNFLYLDAVSMERTDGLLVENYDNVDFDQLFAESILEKVEQDPLDFLYQGEAIAEE